MALTNVLLTAAVNSIADATVKAAVKAEADKLATIMQDNIAGALDVGAVPNAAGMHAAMFAHLCLGMKTSNSVANLKGVVGSWSAADCASDLDAVHKSWKERTAEIGKSKSTGYFGSVVLGPSFYRYANSEERRVARIAIGAAQQMLLKAVISIASVRANSTSEASQKYADYFGPHDPIRYAKVRNNIKKMYGVMTTKPVLLYYRGTRVGGIDDSGDFGGAAASTGSVAETWTDAQISNVTSNLHVYKNEAKCSAVSHIWLGTAAFESGASGPQSTGGKRSVVGEMSIAGTILHELTHFLCSTADEVHAVCTGWDGGKCYGNANVKALAGTDQTKACNNADSYRYYFEQFQSV